MELHKVQLYGGAIETSLPTNFKDVSRCNVVPDNQEVYEEDDTACKLIIELLERDASVPNNQCATYYFNNLATVNQSSSARVSFVEHFQTVDGWLQNINASGVQISKWKAFEDVLRTNRRCEQAADTEPLKLYPEAPFLPFPLVDCIVRCVGEQEITRLKQNHRVHVNMAVVRIAAPVNTDIILTFYSPKVIDGEASEPKTRHRSDAEDDRILGEAIRCLCISDWALFLVK